MASQMENSLRARQTRFPASLVWIVGGACCDPLLLNLLGLDFGTQSALDRLIHGASDPTNLIPFTWALCSLFTVLIIIVGILLAFGVAPQHILGSLIA